MALDLLIKKYSKSLTLKRASGDVGTFGYIVSTKLNDIQNRSNLYDLIIVSDSGIVVGDVVYDGSRYYLTVTVADKTKQGNTAYIACMLLHCNVSVDIKRYVGGILTTVKSGVRCLLTKSRLDTLDDDAVYRKDRARGDQPVTYIYMSSTETLKKGDLIVDGSISLKVLNDLSLYTVKGLIEAQGVIQE